MRILYSHYLTDDAHPAAQMVKAIATELSYLGHEVRVQRSAGNTGAVSAPVTASRQGVVRRGLWFAKELARNRNSLQRDAAAIREFRPDVVLCRQDAYRWSMPLACRDAGIPLVTYADAPVAYECRHFNAANRWHPPGVLERVERWGLSQSAAVVTVSEPAARLLTTYGLRIPIHAIPNGVDADRFTPTSFREWTATRERLGVETPHVVGFVGTFRPFHGLGLLRRLIVQSLERADLTWLLVGDGEGRTELQKVFAGNRRVIFTGRQPIEEVRLLLGAMDVVVAPYEAPLSEFYFCPLKILEAMAVGVPCLASHLGDIPNLLGDGGWTVHSSNTHDWSDELTRLLAQPTRRERMGYLGRSRVEHHFTWTRTASRVATILEGVITREPAA